MQSIKAWANADTETVGWWVAILALWAPLTILLAESKGFGWGGNPLRFVFGPLVLFGITAAIRRLLRQRQRAWSYSAVLAALIAIAALVLTTWLVG